MEDQGIRPVIFGCSGPILSVEERAFFERAKPLGFILFERNCMDPNQVRALVSQLRECVSHEPCILIDQEGGRVARLKPPHWHTYSPAHVFGDMAQDDLDKAVWCTQANAYLQAQELKELGITVNCSPVVDLSHPGAHNVIGDRAFSAHVETVVRLSEAAIQGYLAGGIIPMIKHLPGHGRAQVDSHESLPIVTEDAETLSQTDAAAFRFLVALLEERAHHIWGMTAHIVYEAFDKAACATHSFPVIQSLIRDYIGFRSFLVSDCLTMKALSGSFFDRAERALKAGCDAVLHCNGNLNEMLEFLPIAPLLSSVVLSAYTAPLPQQTLFGGMSIQEIRHQLDRYLHEEPIRFHRRAL